MINIRLLLFGLALFLVGIICLTVEFSYDSWGDALSSWFTSGHHFVAGDPPPAPVTSSLPVSAPTAPSLGAAACTVPSSPVLATNMSSETTNVTSEANFSQANTEPVEPREYLWSTRKSDHCVLIITMSDTEECSGGFFTNARTTENNWAEKPVPTIQDRSDDLENYADCKKCCVTGYDLDCERVPRKFEFSFEGTVPIDEKLGVSVVTDKKDPSSRIWYQVLKFQHTPPGRHGNKVPLITYTAAFSQ